MRFQPMHCSTCTHMPSDLSLSTMVAHMMFSDSHEEKVFLGERGIEGNTVIPFAFLLAKGVVELSN